VQLLKQKCLPVFLYALEVCNLDKKSTNSLDFTLNRYFMKLFKTSDLTGDCETLSEFFWLRIA